MTAPENVVQLVERFERNIDDYRSGKYNETQVRIEFVDPLFKALGWDVDNEQGHAERYKDVIHEDAVKIGGSTKAPDYSFRIGGLRKFFVEAKKPSVNLKDDTAPAYQVRRYAWSAKLPVSILTDFEEFAVYDCRNRPAKTDNAATSRVMYLKYKDYIDQWDMLYETYSREAVLKGAFDKFVEEFKTARGTQEVDAAFLAEIERWRDELARNLALRNEDLNQRQLNFAVQRTIDRIIFLRIAEDRGIEPYQQLSDLTKGEEVYQSLMRLFQRADDRYNSGLFHFRVEKGRVGYPDYLTPALKLDNRVLKGILSNLYYPDSPYEFSVLPAEILGQVYEQFLGKVIRLTAGHQAKIEEKPEVKKAGGVYYTPTYIVDYIVQHTVGKLVEGKTPRQVNKLRVLDPACGSGSFLLGAYQYLLNWHLEYYLKSEVKSHKRRIYQVGEKDWRLTTEERKRILLNNIYGVDIDSQAVEVTKLSLLLKVLEGENQQQLELRPERVLPDLGNNIKCGNSLIGPDFYEGQQMGMFEMDADERMQINAFDWETEFTEIMRAGGFDAVIGNPPYVRQETLGEQFKIFAKNVYKSYSNTADLYVYFIEKGISLLNPKGMFGMIVSNKWLRAAYGKAIRSFLSLFTSVKKIIDFAGLPVFVNATVRTIILIASPTKKESTDIFYLPPISMEEFSGIQSGNDIVNLEKAKSIAIDNSGLSSDGWRLSGKETQKLLERLSEASTNLKTYIGGKTYRGIITGLNKAFVIDKETYDRFIDEDSNSKEILKPLLGGRNLRQYSINYKNQFLIWTYIGVPIDKYPAIFEHLKQFQQKLQKRQDQGKNWWELRACDYYKKFEEPKIIYPDIATSCRFSLDLDGYFSTNTTYFIPGDDLYLLGILNSNISFFYLQEVCAGLEGGGSVYLRFFGQYLNKLPIRTINLDDPTDKAQHDKIVSLVESMLSLHRQLAAASTPHEQTALQRQIDTTDKQIDGLVYALYGLTEEEIKIVEGSV